ncbi:myocardin-related transcription factor A isoform X3 [Rhinatrema bivittatum]|uniref:myocardin-related transcription factor A isoform X3 n=1 Tax=Rhinatrema bivittatum TaxID=194408 RepID=UPI0011277E25|nr:myocardin-related transcription factor A isoform X3 [Rhinatrema bivittatum]
MPAHEINIVASTKAKVDFSILLCPPPSSTGNGLDGGGAGDNEEEAALAAPSPQSEAVTNELQELSLQPDMCLNLTLNPNLPPLSERKNVLQLKLQQRRTREELVNQGIMPPLKSPAAFHEQRRNLERARTEDYLKRKIRSRPERSELVRMHILEGWCQDETSAEPSLQAKQLKLKRARLADDLNEKIAQRPGPMELVEKNILPVESSLKEAIIEGQMNYGAVADSSSFDEDSSDALSPEQPASQDSQTSVSSPLELKACEPLSNTMLSPNRIVSQSQLNLDLPELLLPPELDQQHSNLINSALIPIKPLPTLIKQSQPKSASEKSQRSKKAKEPKPKVKKLKYHQYIPPDQKQEKGALPMDSSYAKILQQQQLFLQLQILNQQQQHYNYQTILPAPPKPSGDTQMSSGASAHPGRNISSVAANASAVTASLGSGGLMRQNSSAPGGKVGHLPPNLDDMKVAELKQELKQRGLPVSGTKIDLIERLKAYQELNGTLSTSVAVSKTSTTILPKTGEVVVAFPASRLSTGPALVSSMAPTDVTAAKLTSGAFMKLGSTSSTPPVSPTPSEHSMISIDENSTNDTIGEMVSSPLTQLTLQTSPVPLLVKEENSAMRCSLAKVFSVGKEADSRDKDQMLQEKDKQIEELTRMLKQKQQLVEMLRLQLQQEKCSQQVGLNGTSMASGKERLLGFQVKQESEFQTCQLSGSGFTPHIGQMDKLNATTSQIEASETNPVPKNTIVVKQEVLGNAVMPCQSPAVPHVFLSRLPHLQVKMGGQSKALKVTSPPPTFNTDATETHLVLTVNSPNSEQESLSPQSSVRKGCTVLQRAQSMPTNTSKHSPEQPTSNSRSKPQMQAGLFNQSIPKGQKQNRQVVTGPLPNAILSYSAPPNLQPFFNGLHKQLPRSGKSTAQHSTVRKTQNSSQPVSPHQPVTQLDLEPPHSLFTPSQSNRTTEPPGYEESVKQQPKLPQASRSSSQQMDDLIDILIQSGEMYTEYKEQPSPALKEMPPPSSKPSATMGTSSPAAHCATGLPLPVSLGPITTPGKLEDFLESTTGASLLTLDQDGMIPLTLIDDLHNEMLSSSAFLDHPLSPMDTSELHFIQESASTALDLCDTNLDSMDWLELSGVPAMSLAPLSNTTPSLFSTDFLDGHDLHLHWDSCL